MRHVALLCEKRLDVRRIVLKKQQHKLHLICNFNPNFNHSVNLTLAYWYMQTWARS